MHGGQLEDVRLARFSNLVETGDHTWVLLSPAGGGRGQAHESVHQHDREEALQHHALREQPGQLQVKTSEPGVFPI